MWDFSLSLSLTTQLPPAPPRTKDRPCEDIKEKGFHQEPDHASNQITDVQAPEQKYMLFKPQSLWYLLQYPDIRQYCNHLQMSESITEKHSP